MLSQYDVICAGSGLPPPSGSIGETLGPSRVAGGARVSRGAQGLLPPPWFSQGTEERRRVIDEWKRGSQDPQAAPLLGSLPGMDAGVDPGASLSAWLGPGGLGRGMPGAYWGIAPSLSASIFGPEPAPSFRPGGGVTPGLRAPLGEAVDVYVPPAPRDYLFEATGFRQAWGEPPRAYGMRWNAARLVYEPERPPRSPGRSGAYGSGTTDDREHLDNLRRARSGIFFQAYREGEGPSAPWAFRWVQVGTPLPSIEQPYTFYAPGDAFWPKPPSSSSAATVPDGPYGSPDGLVGDLGVSGESSASMAASAGRAPGYPVGAAPGPGAFAQQFRSQFDPATRVGQTDFEEQQAWRAAIAADAGAVSDWMSE